MVGACVPEPGFGMGGGLVRKGGQGYAARHLGLPSRRHASWEYSRRNVIHLPLNLDRGGVARFAHSFLRGGRRLVRLELCAGQWLHRGPGPDSKLAYVLAKCQRLLAMP